MFVNGELIVIILMWDENGILEVCLMFLNFVMVFIVGLMVFFNCVDELKIEFTCVVVLLVLMCCCV